MSTRVEVYPSRGEAVVASGLQFLEASQQEDGCFLDFELPPGTSDGWMTGYTTWAIANIAGACQMVERATSAICSMRRSRGWGYNSRTATDADSTAFSLMALEATGFECREEVALLDHYIRDGAAHTFTSKTMGRWSAGHPDVSASVGLALNRLEAPPRLRREMIYNHLAGRSADGTWSGFWWSTPWYTTWMSAQWLRAEGLMSHEIAQSLLAAVGTLREDLTVFDLACITGIAVEALAVHGRRPHHLLAMLTSQQMCDGGWPSSCCLLVPPQFAGADGHEIDGSDQRYPDIYRVFTTATALRVLSGV